MRSRISAPRKAAASVTAMLVLLLPGCRPPGETGQSADARLADRLEKLPVLPADLAATLDPKTNATKIAVVQPLPVKETGTKLLAPCCGSKDQKSLKVKVSLTKCGPLRDFILAPIGDLVMAREAGGGGGVTAAGAAGAAGNVKAYRFNTVSRTTVLDTIVCVTSDGPWDATFIEDRNCNNYQPQDSLFVSAWGGIVAYYWNGGTPNHPPQVQVVSCRDIGTFRYPCNALSGCNCQSAPCPADQPCVCTPPW